MMEVKRKFDSASDFIDRCRRVNDIPLQDCLQLKEELSQYEVRRSLS